MDWWTLLLFALVLTVLTGLVEETWDHPDWAADPPFVRWTANVVGGAVTGVIGMLLLYATVAFWRVASTIAFAVVVLWLLVMGMIRLLELVGVGTRDADPNRER